MKYKIGAVSYINTKPLVFAFENGYLHDKIDLVRAYPAAVAKQLQTNTIDIGLAPVAILHNNPQLQIVSTYGIASSGKVATVALFSNVPLNEITEIELDYQSKTSVALVQILAKYFWKMHVRFAPAAIDEAPTISGAKAAVIIGDRAFAYLQNTPYVYDLAAEWNKFTNLPFVFAGWIANKKIDDLFLKEFNEGNKQGLEQIQHIVNTTHFPLYNLEKYYKENLDFKLTDKHLEGLDLFLKLLKTIN